MFGNNKIKGLKQGIQNRIWSPMSERGILVLIIHNNTSLKVCFGTALHYKSNQRTMKEEKPFINSLKILYCLIKTRIDLVSLSFSNEIYEKNIFHFNVIKQLQSFVSVNTSFYGP